MTNKAPKKHSAPGPMAGYSFQFYRALYWLSKATSETMVAIETDDDVTVEEKNGNFVFEQDKHSISAKNINPLADNSKALWNTLRIWLDLIKNSGVQPESSRFLIVTNKNVPDNCLIKQIASATSDEDLKLCVTHMRSISISLNEIVEEVLGYDDNALKRILKRIELVDQTSNQDNSTLPMEIIENLRIPSIIKAQSEEIFHEMLGWVQQTAMRAWSEAKPAVIQGQQFINALDAAKRSRIRDKTLERSAHLIEVPGDQIDKHRGSIFVEQMRLITEDQSEINDAINDFIKSSSELFRLSDEGELTPTDLVNLEYNMVDRWKPIRRRNMRIHKDKNDKEVGYRIFDETTNNYLVSIGGLPTEHPYFTRGAYHRLSENLLVGWHPKFEDILSKS
ncbi:MAG: hypothetical protein IIA61_13795 [Candidatus Marinimicrobia bacterium]|nr:hypothetical protein [Candidatus Neomarinimicrobiota bacterium]